MGESSSSCTVICRKSRREMKPVENPENQVENRSTPVHGRDGITNLPPLMGSLVSTANTMRERAKEDVERIHHRIMRVCFAGFSSTIHELYKFKRDHWEEN